MATQPEAKPQEFPSLPVTSRDNAIYRNREFPFIELKVGEATRDFANVRVTQFQGWNIIEYGDNYIQAAINHDAKGPRAYRHEVAAEIVKLLKSRNCENVTVWWATPSLETPFTIIAQDKGIKVENYSVLADEVAKKAVRVAAGEEYIAEAERTLGMSPTKSN